MNTAIYSVFKCSTQLYCINRLFPFKSHVWSIRTWITISFWSADWSVMNLMIWFDLIWRAASPSRSTQSPHSRDDEIFTQVRKLEFNNQISVTWLIRFYCHLFVLHSTSRFQPHLNTGQIIYCRPNLLSSVVSKRWSSSSDQNSSLHSECNKWYQHIQNNHQ